MHVSGVFCFGVAIVSLVISWWLLEEWNTGDRVLVYCLLATFGICAVVLGAGRYGARHCYTSEQRKQAASRPRLAGPIVPRTTSSVSYEDFMANYIAESQKKYRNYLDGGRSAQ